MAIKNSSAKRRPSRIAKFEAVQRKSKNEKPESRVLAASSLKVGIIMGSDSDFPIMKEAGVALKSLNISFETRIVSAHRTPDEMFEYARSARARGLRVIIAGAGGAAHLPGMVAALTELPVIGVPVPIGHLQGEDALLSIVQMPRGVPVATVAIGNAFNAGLLAAQIMAAGGSAADEELLNLLRDYKESLRLSVLKKKLDPMS